MENEKIFELMEKMYVGMNSKMDKMYVEVQEGFKKVNERLDTVENRVRKVDFKLEELDKKVDFSLEGHKTNTEQLNRIEKEVTKHEEFLISRVK